MHDASTKRLAGRIRVPQGRDTNQGIRVGAAAADDLVTAVSSAVLMQIGDRVIHDGRVLVLLGHDPMSVPDRVAEVADPTTGERFAVPLDDLVPAEPYDEGFDPAA